MPPFNEPVLATEEFIGDEDRDQIERREPLALGLAEPGFEHGGHAREAELAEGEVEFDEGHVGSPIFWSMRSR